MDSGSFKGWQEMPIPSGIYLEALRIEPGDADVAKYDALGAGKRGGGGEKGGSV